VSKIDTLIAVVAAELGKPYLFGADGPDQFDCSGLTEWGYAHVGISLPHKASEQQKLATPVKNPLPGDLVFYGQPAHHVGLYIGGGKMIDAPDRGLKVRIDNVGTPTGYGRVPGSGAAAAVPAGVASAAGSGLSSVIDEWVIKPLRNLLLEGGFVVLGLGLVGYGIWRAVTPTRDNRSIPQSGDDQ
jgi:hypothetical protein